jgi:hypothetical protein
MPTHLRICALSRRCVRTLFSLTLTYGLAIIDHIPRRGLLLLSIHIGYSMATYYLLCTYYAWTRLRPCAANHATCDVNMLHARLRAQHRNLTTLPLTPDTCECCSSQCAPALRFAACVAFVLCLRLCVFVSWAAAKAPEAVHRPGERVRVAVAATAVAKERRERQIIMKNLV